MNILFICTGNTCRSPMAQAYFNSRAGQCKKACSADSAGIAAFAGQPASVDALEIMKELYGIDMSDHSSKQVNEELIAKADLVLAMTETHKTVLRRAYPNAVDKIFTLAEYAGPASISTHEVRDPYGMGMSAYKEAVKQITAMIDIIIERICTAE